MAEAENLKGAAEKITGILEPKGQPEKKPEEPKAEPSEAPEKQKFKIVKLSLKQLTNKHLKILRQKKLQQNYKRNQISTD